MSIDFHENLEPTGYRETWTIGEITTDGTVNEDAAAAVTGWGSQSLEITVNNTGPAYVRTDIADATTPFYLRFEVELSSESLSDGQAVLIFGIYHAATNVLFTSYFAQVAGVLYIYADTYYDGSSHPVQMSSITTGTKYRVEWKWNLTDNTYAMWLDGVSKGSGSITGAPQSTPYQVNNIIAGTVGATSHPATYQLDRITYSRSAQINKAPIAPVRAGAGFAGVLRRGMAA